MDNEPNDIGKQRIPFGISGLDNKFDGIPVGSFVLLAGEVDSGVDEFAYTNASMLSMAINEPSMFNRNSDTEVDQASLPKEVHYVSLERNKELVLKKFDSVLDRQRYNVLVDNIIFKDFSEQYLSSMPLSTPLTGGDKTDSNQGFQGLLNDLCGYLNQNAPDSIVVIDSLTSLMKATEFDLKESQVLSFLTHLTNASRLWDGLVYVLFHRVHTEVREDAELATTPDGVMYFGIEELGGELHRTMYVGSFRGTLSKTQDRITIFNSQITGDGFEVSTVREIL